MTSFSLFKTPGELLQNLAAKLKRLRKNSGFSQSVLATRSGVSLGSIKRFEGSGHISLVSLLKLAHVLGRMDELDRLFNEEESNKKIEKLFSDRTRNDTGK